MEHPEFDDYLWRGRGLEDPEVAALEQRLRPLRELGQRETFSPTSASVTSQRRRRVSHWRTVVAAVACAAGLTLAWLSRGRDVDSPAAVAGGSGQHSELRLTASGSLAPLAVERAAQWGRCHVGSGEGRAVVTLDLDAGGPGSLTVEGAPARLAVCLRSVASALRTDVTSGDLRLELDFHPRTQERR